MLGGFAAAVGIPFGLFFFWPVASLPLLSAAMCAHLIVRCECRWRSPKVAVVLVGGIAAWSILVAAAIFALPYLDRPA